MTLTTRMPIVANLPIFTPVHGRTRSVNFCARTSRKPHKSFQPIPSRKAVTKERKGSLSTNDDIEDNNDTNLHILQFKNRCFARFARAFLIFLHFNNSRSRSKTEVEWPIFRLWDNNFFFVLPQTAYTNFIPGATFSKSRKLFGPEKTTRKTPIHSFCKAGLLIRCNGNKN